MQDNTQTPLPPERIGNYQRVGESPLGVGGMGVVWLYRETGLSSREVAIKFIRPDENTELNKASLIKDIKAMDALPNHQNIIIMHAVIEEQGNIALVMEYVPGGITLKKVVQDNPNGLPIPLAKEILAGILSGVAHAHEHGVIHRDIKPDNILMRQPKQGAEFSRNSAKIADFGISRVHKDGTRRLSTVVAFTEAYAAPEQINAEETSGFTDVYAIGVVLYEMLAGRRPFEGKTSEIIIGHCHKAPPPINRADLPSGLKVLLDKALQKEPADRYRDAIEMLAEYQELDRTGQLGLSSPQTETTTTGESTAESQVSEDYDKTIVSGEKRNAATTPPTQQDAEKLREEEAKRRAEEEARRSAEEEAKHKIEKEARRQADTEAGQVTEDYAKTIVSGEKKKVVVPTPPIQEYAAEIQSEEGDYAKTIVSGEKRKVVSGPSPQAEVAAEKRNAEEANIYAAIPRPPGMGMSTASLVLGIVTLVVSVSICGSPLAIPLALVGLILGIVGRKKLKIVGIPFGRATAGIVMSIIGISIACVISTSLGTILAPIAVPAFIGQRDSAKDKAAQANCASILTAFMAAINKAEEDGKPVNSVAAINTLVDTKDVNTALVPEIYRYQNPWNKAEPAYLWRGVIAADKSYTFEDAIKTLATSANKGQVQLAAGNVGGNLVIGAAVYLNKPVGKTNNADDYVMVKIQGVG